MYSRQEENGNDELALLIQAFDRKMAKFECLSDELEELATRIESRADELQLRSDDSSHSTQNIPR